MCIQVDNRAGSVDLAPMLRTLGCEVDLCRMEFGDVAFTGLGANGDPVSVGIECKTLDDVLACIISGRFAGHQLPGLIKSYDHVYLLVQGQWRARIPDGTLQQYKFQHGREFWMEAGGGQRRWMWRDLEAWLTSMAIMGGLRVHRVPDWREGTMWLKTVYNWFQKETHQSHQVVYGGKELYTDRALLVRPSLARRIAKELPGIGVVRSADVAHEFHTLEQMVSASVKDWTRVPGVGKGIAEKVWKSIHTNGSGSK